MKAWSADMKFTREELFSIPIWVKLLGLDFKYWSAKGLSKLSSLIGKPLMEDKNTKKKLGLNFAKLLVEVKVGEKLPKVIYFRNEKGSVIEQRVTYECRPSICKKYGHTKDICRKSKATKEGRDQKTSKQTDKDTQQNAGNGVNKVAT